MKAEHKRSSFYFSLIVQFSPQSGLYSSPLFTIALSGSLGQEYVIGHRLPQWSGNSTLGLPDLNPSGGISAQQKSWPIHAISQKLQHSSYPLKRQGKAKRLYYGFTELR